jgi:hypothetical protein
MLQAVFLLVEIYEAQKYKFYGVEVCKCFRSLKDYFKVVQVQSTDPLIAAVRTGNSNMKSAL